MDLMFIITVVLLGVGLSMDAFSTSVVNVVSFPESKGTKAVRCASMYMLFQFVFFMLGWAIIHAVATRFKILYYFMPWLALLFLLRSAWSLIVDGVISLDEDKVQDAELDFKEVTIQGIMSSLDALSMGFVTAYFSFKAALVAGIIVGAITFFISIYGFCAGEKLGVRVTGKTAIIGGLILAAIGIKIVVEFIFF